MVHVFSLDGSKVSDVELPELFKQTINDELLMRAYLSENSARFQLKYTDPLAGKRKAAELTKRRRAYKTTYGHQLNRTPRKTLSHIGSSFSYVGAIAPHTVGGREAHPPKAERVLIKKMNKKERQLAIRMGIAGSANKDAVSRFHAVKELTSFPLVIDDKFNDISKTKEAVKALSAIGLAKELDRVTERKIRAGKGKLRGRKYKKKLAVVLVTTEDARISKAARNLNIKVIKPDRLSVSDVSQAGRPGRFIVWTKKAIESLGS